MMLKKRFLPKDLSMLRITVNNTRNSFFGELSRRASTHINLEIFRVPDMDQYIVFAYSYGKNVDKYALDLVQNNEFLRRSKIQKIKVWCDSGLTYIIAVKKICEFFSLAENNSVTILSPYTFDRGRRIYVALGKNENLRNYIADVKKYYGPKNITYRQIDAVEHLSNLLPKRSLMSIILDKLTDKELNILRIAYREGYFDYPHKTSLEEISEKTMLSKVTVGIHLRKALRKIMDELMRLSTYTPHSYC